MTRRRPSSIAAHTRGRGDAGGAPDARGGRMLVVPLDAQAKLEPSKLFSGSDADETGHT